MESHETLLPVLEVADWSGADHAAVRPLLPGEVDWVPWVSMAYDSAESRRYLTRTKLAEDGLDGEVLLARARAALVKRGIGLRPRPDGSVIAIDEYASSLLTSVIELERVRMAVGTPRILLAAPTRGCLVAVPFDADRLAPFRDFARHGFAEALDTRLTPLVFSWDGANLDLAPDPEAAAPLREVGYDDDDERLTLAADGPLDVATARALDKTLLSGRTRDGRAVAEIVLRMRPRDAAASRLALHDDITLVTVEDP